MKENFYHGILLGILGVKDQWIVESNKEMGEGYGDIVIETENGETGIIIEIKYNRFRSRSMMRDLRRTESGKY